MADQGGIEIAVAVFHYPGGKAKLASWIGGRLPPPGSYGVFVDLFGGAASVLLEVMRRNDLAGKRPHYIYNDRDEELVNFFRVLRDRKMRDELREMLRWTPYARKEYGDCIEMPVPVDQVQRAWRFFVLQQQTFAGCMPKPGRWAYDTRKRFVALQRWLNSQDRLEYFGKIFRQVQIECLDFTGVLKRYDGVDVLVYADPPYYPDTRFSNDIYVLELTRERHGELAGLLNGFSGMAAVSGYRCPEYDEWYSGWERHDREVLCHMSPQGGAGEHKPHRVESLWLNPAAVKKLERAQQASLF